MGLAWIAQTKAGALLQRLRTRTADLGLGAELGAMRGVEGWLAKEEAELLFALARGVETGCIVEVGSYRGRSTIALALGSRRGHGAPVFAFDPHEPFTGALGGDFGPEDRAAFYRNMLRSGCYRNVRLINLGSETVTRGWSKTVSLLWIDGDHSYQGVSRDFNCWRPHLAPGAQVVFDDSLDPRIGPAQLIEELLESGAFERVRTVGKVTLLCNRRCPAATGSARPHDLPRQDRPARA
jgi:MMP 1-O-methyltransferase